MVQHVYERTRQASLVAEVVVATDDRRIYEAVRRFGGVAEMTRSDHETGTDRLAEVAGRSEADVIVNVQGDEPLIDPAMIDEAVRPLIADRTLAMSTLMARIRTVDDYLNPNVVKVVTDQEGNALYFSRSPLPLFRDIPELKDEDFQSGTVTSYRHVGLYVYRKEFLLAFAAMPPGKLEQAEKLEQLRALETGHRIRVVETVHDSIGVDTPEDLDKVLARMKDSGCAP